MSRGWKFKSGDWHATCDSCGGKFWASQLRKRWDGFMVCKADFEPRHPQDFLRARKDQISVPWTRPQAELVFLPGSVCTLFNRQGKASYGVADCAAADLDLGQDAAICITGISCVVGIYAVGTTPIGYDYNIYCFDSIQAANNFINNGYQ